MVSDAKQEAQCLMNELAVANAVEADTAVAFERAMAQVKGIDRSQKSMRKQAKWACRVGKVEMEVAAEQQATISHQSSNATWTLHKQEKAGHPLCLEEAQAKTQNASLVMKLADADKVLQSMAKWVNNFNLANHMGVSLLMLVLTNTANVS